MSKKVLNFEFRYWDLFRISPQGCHCEPFASCHSDPQFSFVILRKQSDRKISLRAGSAWQSQESKTQKSKGKNKEGFYLL